MKTRLCTLCAACFVLPPSVQPPDFSTLKPAHLPLSSSSTSYLCSTVLAQTGGRQLLTSLSRVEEKRNDFAGYWEVLLNNFSIRDDPPSLPGEAWDSGITC